MSRVKGRGDKGPVNVAYNEDEDDTVETKKEKLAREKNEKEEKKFKDWAEALIPTLQEIDFPLVHRYNEKMNKRVDMQMYSSYEEIARTVQQTCKEVEFKNITGVHRWFYTIGAHVGVAYLLTLKKDGVALKNNQDLKREFYYLQDLERTNIFDGVRNFADRQYEYVWKGIKTLVQIEQENEEYLDEYIPKNKREEAERIIRERINNGGAKEDLQAKLRQRKHRKQSHDNNCE